MVRQKFSAGVGRRGDPGSTYETLAFARAAVSYELGRLTARFPDQALAIIGAQTRFAAALEAHPDESAYADHFQIRGVVYAAFVRPE